MKRSPVRCGESRTFREVLSFPVDSCEFAASLAGGTRGESCSNGRSRLRSVVGAKPHPLAAAVALSGGLPGARRAGGRGPGVGLARAAGRQILAVGYLGIDHPSHPVRAVQLAEAAHRGDPPKRCVQYLIFSRLQ